MSSNQSRSHHYVPRWYQKRFLHPGQYSYYYLDLKPDAVPRKGGHYKRQDLLEWRPKRCFFRDHLYTLKPGNWTTDEIEKRFFGEIDTSGRMAVEAFSKLAGFRDDIREAFRALPRYMDAQRFRTPRGLDQLRELTRAKGNNLTLLAMQHWFQFHSTMWAEGVWEVVRADETRTKFIVSDEPVTFAKSAAFVFRPGTVN